MSGARILVVDDSLTIRRALEFILKPQGYELEFAADGREALNRATAFTPDLVLLDYVLPDMRGPDVCAALAVMPVTANTPVVLVSAKGASIRQAYQDAQNVVSYITKPFKPEVVIAVVGNALARLRAEGGSPGIAAGANGSSAAGSPPPVHAGAVFPPSPAAGASRPAPATVEETFGALLSQLEDAIATTTPGGSEADIAHGRGPTDVMERLSPGLHRATQHVGDLVLHLSGGGVTPFRLRADGSFASISSTLLEAHRALCEAALALAAAGAPAARLPDPVCILAACAADHPMRTELSRALELTPEISSLFIEGDFAQLPYLVRLLGPEAVIAAADGDPALEAGLQRSRGFSGECAPRFAALGRSGDSGDSGDGSGAPDWADVRLADQDSLARWLGELALRDRSPDAGIEIGLEIVDV